MNLESIFQFDLGWNLYCLFLFGVAGWLKQTKINLAVILYLFAHPEQYTLTGIFGGVRFEYGCFSVLHACLSKNEDNIF